MLKITLIFTCLILFALAQTENESQQLEGKLNDLLRKLRNLIDGAVSKAQKALNAAIAKINRIADRVTNSASSLMNGVLKKVQAELDALKRKAKSKGVNIDECLAGNENALLGLPKKYTGDLVHCVTDRVNEGLHLAQNALNALSRVISDVENIKQEIKQCGHGIKSVGCLAKLTLRIEKDIVSLPVKVEADAAAAAALVTEVGPRIELCASQKTSACGNEATEILKKISVCVARKLIGH